MKGIVIGGVVFFVVLLNILSSFEPEGARTPGVTLTTIVDCSMILMLIVIGFEALLSKFESKNNP